MRLLLLPLPSASLDVVAPYADEVSGLRRARSSSGTLRRAPLILLRNSDCSGVKFSPLTGDTVVVVPPFPAPVLLGLPFSVPPPFCRICSAIFSMAAIRRFSADWTLARHRSSRSWERLGMNRSLAILAGDGEGFWDDDAW